MSTKLPDSKPSPVLKKMASPEIVEIQQQPSYKSTEEVKPSTTSEYGQGLEKVQEKRLIEVRIWILVNYFIFFITAPTIHFFRWDRLDNKGKIALIIMSS